MRRRSTACLGWPAVLPRGGPAADSRGAPRALGVRQDYESASPTPGAGRSRRPIATVLVLCPPWWAEHQRWSVVRVGEDRAGLQDGEGDQWPIGSRGPGHVGTRAAVHAEGGAPGGGQRGGVGAGAVVVRDRLGRVRVAGFVGGEICAVAGVPGVAAG